MTYLLDSNACISWLNDSTSPVAKRLSVAHLDSVFLCEVVMSELYYGAFRSAKSERNIARLEEFQSLFGMLPFDGKCSRIAGRIRAELAARGNPIGPYEVLIAATAIAHNAVLVSRNTREFARVPGLLLEDWEKE